MKYIFLSLLLSLCAAAVPVELGKVEWDRKLEPSLEKAAKDGKPIFLLFQEIPG